MINLHCGSRVWLHVAQRGACSACSTFLWRSLRDVVQHAKLAPHPLRHRNVEHAEHAARGCGAGNLTVSPPRFPSSLII